MHEANIYRRECDKPPLSNLLPRMRRATRFAIFDRSQNSSVAELSAATVIVLLTTIKKAKARTHTE